MIIQKATHDSYADQLRKRIIKPLGLHDLFLSAAHYPPSVISRVPAGYWYIPPKDMPALGSQFRKNQTPYPIPAPASGGIVSSPTDVARWSRALFAGRVLPTKQQRELESLVSEKTGKPIKKTTVADPAGFGLGLQQTKSPILGTMWTYEGETFGFRFILAYQPRSGTVIAIGTNSKPLHDELPQLFVSVYRSLHTPR
jgi:D-alanyl-D-alanine carboxypeptidase